MMIVYHILILSMKLVYIANRSPEISDVPDLKLTQAQEGFPMKMAFVCVRSLRKQQ